VHRLALLFAAACLTAVVLAPTASPAGRMWVGFHDDPVLRYDDGREAEMVTARSAGATIARTLVTWSNIAPTRPANAANPFDPAYKFDDLDELVRNAQKQGMEVLITLWGTPGWANGGKTPNFLPRRMSDFQNFARAVAARYSGRNAGYPFVRFFGIWNESNLGQFLSPQFNSRGAIVGPAQYAKLAAAGYTGIKSVSPRALVAIGETSARGRDKKKAGVSDTVSPGKFAELVAKANKRLRFDAWAHHPYPNPINGKPTQVVKWPNVSLKSMPRFETSLDTWFGRKNTRLWITEYGHETKPGEPRGVTEAQQAAYVKQAMNMAKKDARVDMFIWFVLRDSKGSEWQSGIFRTDGSAKPSEPRFAATARGLSPVNGWSTVKAGTKNPVVKLYLREFCNNNPTGSAVGTTARTYVKGKLVQVSQQQVPLAVDCAANVRVAGLTVAKKVTYVVQFEVNTAISGTLQRTVTLVGR
jgi:Cellulase (glycosyl hydrolase family 5)